jgi:hypothetical protein
MSLHPVIENLIQTQQTHYMAQYYLVNMAINIPKNVDPAFESIMTQIISANQVCQSLLTGLSHENENKLKQRVEQSSKIINQTVQNTLLLEHQVSGLDIPFEYKTVPIEEALHRIMKDNKETLTSPFAEVIRGRLLVYYIQ